MDVYGDPWEGMKHHRSKLSHALEKREARPALIEPRAPVLIEPRAPALIEPRAPALIEPRAPALIEPRAIEALMEPLP
eukprot:Skav230441  [mRNA]  locus=scaffold3496:39038:39271:+ [translate_table: standard]